MVEVLFGQLRDVSLLLRGIVPACVKEGNSTMNGDCNFGTVSTNNKGWYVDFKFWLNKKGIANLLSLPH